MSRKPQHVVRRTQSDLAKELGYSRSTVTGYVKYGRNALGPAAMILARETGTEPDIWKKAPDQDTHDANMIKRRDGLERYMNNLVCHKPAAE